MANIEIHVPDIGDFAEVTVIELLVKVGDTIHAEQSLITVESDKASMEIPSAAAGVVTAIKVANPPYNADGDSTWSATQQNAANGKVALIADQQTLAANPIVDASGKVAGVTLTVSGLVSTFAVGIESVAAGGATAITTVNGVSTNVDVCITKTAGAVVTIGNTGTLEIVTDTGKLGTVGDNQLHMVTTYDKASDLTHLMIQYDTNAAKDTTSLSSVVAMDFGGDVTNLIPASLIFTGP